MIKNITFSIFVFITFFSFTTQAQVTIGSNLPPAKGALLDLKQWEGVAGGTTASKGLGIPRVELQSSTSLQPCTDETINNNAKKSVGLVVFNTGSKGGLCPGLYVWTKSKWQRLHKEECFLLDVSENMLFFPSNVGGSNPSHSLKIEWAPSSLIPTMALNPMVGGGIKGYTPSTTISTGGNFNETITVDAMTALEIAGNPFLSRESVLNLELCKSAGDCKQKAVTLRQTNYAILSDDIQPSYLLDGSTFTFHVRSNVPWKIKGVNQVLSSGTGNLLNIQASDNLNNTTSGGNNTGAGDLIRFTVPNSSTNLSGIVNAVFENTDNPKLIGDVTIPINLTSFFLNTTDNVVVFPSNVGGSNPSHNLGITWMPSTLTPTMTLTPTAGGGIKGYIPTASIASGGSFNETITVNAMTPNETTEPTGDPLLIRESALKVEVCNGGLCRNKTVTLRQVNYGVIAELSPVFLMDGKEKSFTIKSNARFTIRLGTNPSSVIQSLKTTSGGTTNTVTSTSIKFNIINDLPLPTINQASPTLIISSPDGLFPDKTITLNCESATIQPKANSYIVKPGGGGILIPTARANDPSIPGVGLGTNETFTTELVWTENSNRISANSNISQLQPAGIGTSGYVLVIPGTGEGNAVVAIKNNSGTIVWSWHIWVTDYTPSGWVMDRNLGALSTTPATDSCLGLLYQWGRKDPFPNKRGGGEPALYNATGTTAIVQQDLTRMGTVSDNRRNSVNNPSTFYSNSGSGALGDWYSNTGARNDNLWQSSKTVYDPCPNGWRMPYDGFYESGTWGTDYFEFWEKSITGIGNDGMNWPSKGGFYPAAGKRMLNGGNINSGDGYYWMAGKGTGGSSSEVYNARYMMVFFGSQQVYPDYSHPRSFGYSVRCVAGS